MAPSAPARIRLGLALALSLAVLPFAGSAPAAAASDLLPDLKMHEMYNLQIKSSAAGGKKLRFGTIVWNVGDGPLDVEATKRAGPTMSRVSQWIRTSNGSEYEMPRPAARAFYSGDGHNHWHIQGFIVVQLYPAAPLTSGVSSVSARSLRKIGFCLTDLVRGQGDLRPAGSAPRIRFPVSGCGTRQSQSVRMGISVGYGDDYKPFFARQAIDITDLPRGIYRLCATVNPSGLWLEKDDNRTNNSYWMDIDLDAARSKFTVTDTGETPCDARSVAIVYGTGA